MNPQIIVPEKRLIFPPRFNRTRERRASYLNNGPQHRANNVLFGNTGAAAVTPPPSNVLLYSHMDTTAPDIYAFADDSSYARTLTNSANLGSGNPTQTDTSIFKFGTASGRFQTNGIVKANSADFNIGTSEVTYAFWSRPTAPGGSGTVFFSHGPFTLYHSTLQLYLNDGVTNFLVMPPIGAAPDFWYFEVTRDNTTLPGTPTWRVYLSTDGVTANQVGVTTSSGSLNLSNQNVWIGGYQPLETFGPFGGWIDEFLMQTTCRHPGGASFAVPSAPFY